SASMTAAGAATLFITNDYLRVAKQDQVTSDKALQRALDWLGDHFAVNYNAGRDPPPQKDQDNGVEEGEMQMGGMRLRFRRRVGANIVHFMRHASERHMNWQIVGVDAPLSDLREAPILYLSGDRPVMLSESQRNNLQAYVNEGGLLLFANTSKTDDFTNSVT